MNKVYALRHNTTKTAFVKTVNVPPRLIEWTEDINDVQLFEFEREAKDCAEYIKKTAFDVEVFSIDLGNKNNVMDSSK